MKKTLTTVAVFLLIGAVATWIGRHGGSAVAINDVRRDATEQHMPAGFLGVAWLASRDEVRAKRSTVVEEQLGMLSEPTSLYGRSAKITYYFGSGNLVLFIFTFTDNSSATTFDLTRTQLVKEYGVFPETATSTDDFGPKQCATRGVRRFAIDHCLRTLGGVVQEQVFFARTPG